MSAHTGAVALLALLSLPDGDGPVVTPSDVDLGVYHVELPPETAWSSVVAPVQRARRSLRNAMRRLLKAHGHRVSPAAKALHVSPGALRAAAVALGLPLRVQRPGRPDGVPRRPWRPARPKSSAGGPAGTVAAGEALLPEPEPERLNPQPGECYEDTSDHEVVRVLGGRGNCREEHRAEVLRRATGCATSGSIVWRVIYAPRWRLVPDPGAP